MHVSLPAAAALALLTLILLVPAASADKGKCTALWVHDAPFYYNSHEYSMLRQALAHLGCSVVVKGAWDVNALKNRGWYSWLRGSGYSLIVVSWARGQYLDSLTGFIKDAVRAGVPILYVPGLGLNATKPLGIVMVKNSVFNRNLTVVEAGNPTKGVLTVCLTGRTGVVSTYRLLENRPPGTNYTPLVLAGGKDAAALVGTVNGTRIAAFAPYLYASGCGDTARLIENTLRWLLHLPQPSPEKAADWGSAAVKDLAETRKRLLEEINQLRSERDRLARELAALRQEKNNLASEIAQLKNQAKNNTTAAPRATGCGRSLALVGAASAAAGFAAALAATRRSRGQEVKTG